MFGKKIDFQYRKENEKSNHILAVFRVFGVAVRHVHAEVVLQLAQIVLVGLEHGGLLVEQLAPFLLEVGVGGLLQCQRSADAELLRRRENLGRLLEGERNLENER